MTAVLPSPLITINNTHNGQADALRLAQDLLLTVHSMLAGTANISAKHDENELKWEIKTKEDNPEVIMCYKQMPHLLFDTEKNSSSDIKTEDENYLINHTDHSYSQALIDTSSEIVISDEIEVIEEMVTDLTGGNIFKEDILKDIDEIKNDPELYIENINELEEASQSSCRDLAKLNSSLMNSPLKSLQISTASLGSGVVNNSSFQTQETDSIKERTNEETLLSDQAKMLQKVPKVLKVVMTQFDNLSKGKAGSQENVILSSNSKEKIVNVPSIMNTSLNYIPSLDNQNKTLQESSQKNQCINVPLISMFNDCNKIDMKEIVKEDKTLLGNSLKGLSKYIPTFVVKGLNKDGKMQIGEVSNTAKTNGNRNQAHIERYQKDYNEVVSNLDRKNYLENIIGKNNPLNMSSKSLVEKKDSPPVNTNYILVKNTNQQLQAAKTGTKGNGNNLPALYTNSLLSSTELIKSLSGNKPILRNELEMKYGSSNYTKLQKSQKEEMQPDFKTVVTNSDSLVLKKDSNHSFVLNVLQSNLKSNPNEGDNNNNNSNKTVESSNTILSENSLMLANKQIVYPCISTTLPMKSNIPNKGMGNQVILNFSSANNAKSVLENNDTSQSVSKVLLLHNFSDFCQFLQKQKAMNSNDLNVAGSQAPTSNPSISSTTEVTDSQQSYINEKELVHGKESVQNKERRKYSCRYCGKCFPKRYSRTVHERVHRGIRPYPCRFCEKSFAQYCQRQNHERIHTGEKPYSCSYCDKKFACQSVKQGHERTHTGERPYPCSYCSKRFTRNLLRRNHERIHTGERPYSCSYCDKSFKTLPDKKNHELVHTGEKNYSCNFCPKTFARRQYKNIHERIHVNKGHKLLSAIPNTESTSEELN